MRAIQKLNLVVKFTLFLVFLTVFYFIINKSVIGSILYIVILVLFILGEKIFFKKKINKNHEIIPMTYTFGVFFLFMALISFFGILGDFNKGVGYSLGMLIPLFFGFLGFFWVYYSYKSRKELKIILKMKNKRI